MQTKLIKSFFDLISRFKNKQDSNSFFYPKVSFIIDKYLLFNNINMSYLAPRIENKLIIGLILYFIRTDRNNYHLFT